MIRFVDLSGRLSTPLVVSCALWEPTSVPLRLVGSQNDACQPESLPLFVCGLDFYLLGLDDSSCQPFVSCKCHQCLSHGFFPLHDYGFSNPSLWPICGGVIVDTLTAHFVNGRFSLDLHVNSLDIHLPNHIAPFHRFVLTNLVAQGWQLSSILSYLIDE